MSIPVTTAARLLLGGTFFIAALAKAMNRKAGRDAVVALGFPSSTAALVAWLLPPVELAIALALFSETWASWAAAAGLVLMLAFTAVIAVNLLRGRNPSCHCFGSIAARPIGPATLVRNAALAACAIVVLVVPGDAMRINVLATAAVVIVVAQSAFLWQLFEQHGRLVVRLDHLEARIGAPPAGAGLMRQGLPVGTRAPALDGEDELFAGKKPVVLIFSSTDCPACAAMMPDVARWQKRYADRARISVQRDRMTADAYNVQATPTAILIDVHGVIASEPALGRDDIEALIRGVAAPNESHRERRLQALA